jgi:membrane-associated phospholipid phosphatase
MWWDSSAHCRGPQNDRRFQRGTLTPLSQGRGGSSPDPDPLPRGEGEGSQQSGWWSCPYEPVRLRLVVMTGHWGMTRTTIARCLVGAVVLVAAFAADGPAREARVLVVKAVPKWLLRSLAHGGDVVTLAAVVVALFACGLVAGRSRITRAAFVLASALAATALVVLSVKWLASRGPDGVFHGFGAGDGGIMFPSGHTAMAFAACTVIGLIWQKARWPACLIAVCVAVSRATLIHFLSDVVAGALIGTAVAQGVASWAVVQGFLELEAGPRGASTAEPAGTSAER